MLRYSTSWLVSDSGSNLYLIDLLWGMIKSCLSSSNLTTIDSLVHSTFIIIKKSTSSF